MTSDKSLLINAMPPWFRLMARIKRGILPGGAVLALMLPPPQSFSVEASLSSDRHLTARVDEFAAPRRQEVTAAAAHMPRFAEFKNEPASDEVRHIADWITDSAGSVGLPYVILDKRNAHLFVFDAEGVLQGASPVLLGAAVGDDSVPGIGERAIADVRPEERTTPAGRFVAELGRNMLGEEVIWVDYDAAVSMHRVRAITPAEHRLERLASPTPTDNRISWGCINVPPRFYDEVLLATFKLKGGVVYVLPEVRALHQVFAAYETAPRVEH